MRILGIDIGVTGAMALYQPMKSPESGLRWMVADLPPARQLRTWLRQIEPTVAYYERTWHTGHSHASYKLGYSAGWIKGVLECCDVPTVEAEPGVWKRHFDLIKKPPRASIDAARKYLEGCACIESVRRISDEHRADAVLIAAYGAYNFGPLL